MNTSAAANQKVDNISCTVYVHTLDNGNILCFLRFTTRCKGKRSQRNAVNNCLNNVRFVSLFSSLDEYGVIKISLMNSSHNEPLLPTIGHQLKGNFELF